MPNGSDQLLVDGHENVYGQHVSAYNSAPSSMVANPVAYTRAFSDLERTSSSNLGGTSSEFAILQHMAPSLEVQVQILFSPRGKFGIKGLYVVGAFIQFVAIIIDIVDALLAGSYTPASLALIVASQSAGVCMNLLMWKVYQVLCESLAQLDISHCSFLHTICQALKWFILC
jgi:hypothetical protein